MVMNIPRKSNHFFFLGTGFSRVPLFMYLRPAIPGDPVSRLDTDLSLPIPSSLSPTPFSSFTDHYETGRTIDLHSGRYT